MKTSPTRTRRHRSLHANSIVSTSTPLSVKKIKIKHVTWRNKWQATIVFVIRRLKFKAPENKKRHKTRKSKSESTKQKKKRKEKKDEWSPLRFLEWRGGILKASWANANYEAVLQLSAVLNGNLENYLRAELVAMGTIVDTVIPSFCLCSSRLWAWLPNFVRYMRWPWRDTIFICFIGGQTCLREYWLRIRAFQSTSWNSRGMCECAGEGGEMCNGDNTVTNRDETGGLTVSRYETVRLITKMKNVKVVR